MHVLPYLNNEPALAVLILTLVTQPHSPNINNILKLPESLMSHKTFWFITALIII
jgi:hypothetical protein